MARGHFCNVFLGWLISISTLPPFSSIVIKRHEPHMLTEGFMDKEKIAWPSTANAWPGLYLDFFFFFHFLFSRLLVANTFLESSPRWLKMTRLGRFLASQSSRWRRQFRGPASPLFLHLYCMWLGTRLYWLRTASFGPTAFDTLLEVRCSNRRLNQLNRQAEAESLGTNNSAYVYNNTSDTTAIQSTSV